MRHGHHDQNAQKRVFQDPAFSSFRIRGSGEYEGTRDKGRVLILDVQMSSECAELFS